jgi:hypothetical protein
MPYTVTFSADGSFVRLTARGSFDFASSLSVFEDVAKLLEQHPEAGILVDVREIRYTPSAQDVRQFATAHSEMTRTRHNAHAVVTAPGVNYGMARMVCTLIEIAGGRSRAFTNLEEAERWLSDAVRNASSAK